MKSINYLIRISWLPNLLLATMFLNSNLMIKAQSQNNFGDNYNCSYSPSSLATTVQAGNLFTPFAAQYTPKGRLNILIVPVHYGTGGNAGITPLFWVDPEINPTILDTNKLFYEDPAKAGTYQNLNNLSDYFYTFSNPNDPFIVTANVYPTPVVVPKPANGIGIGYSVNNILDSIQLKDPLFPWHKFDLRTHQSHFGHDNTNDGPDGFLDLVVLVYRDQRGFAITLGADSSRTIYSALDGKTYSARYAISHMHFTNNPIAFIPTFLHEWAHCNYDSPHYSGANNTHGVHFECQHYNGMMDGGGTGFFTPNAWERWQRGWLAEDIHVTPDSVPAAGRIYILKDHATQSSAMRIKIPGSNRSINSSGHDYLWLENHKMINPFDKKKRFTINAAEPMVPGLYAFTVDAPGMDRTQPIGGNYTSRGRTLNANLIKGLSADGNWDWAWTGDSVLNPYTSGFGFLKVWDKAAPNPLSGGTIRQRIPFDKNADNTLRLSIFSGGSSEGGAEQISNAAGPVNNVNVDHWRFAGTGISAFQPGDEISLSSTATALNYPEYYDLNKKNYDSTKTLQTWEPRVLNGLNITFIGYTSTGDAKVLVQYNDYEVRQDKRWTGEITLPDLDPNQINDKLKIASNKTVTLGLSGNPNRETLDSLTQTFSSPSRLSVESGGYLQLATSSQLIVDEYSILRLEAGGKIEVQPYAKLIVRGGGVLELEDASDLNVSYLGKVHIESGGKIIVKGQPGITLDGPGGILEIDGQLEIADNSTFTFQGNYLGTGKVVWGVPAGADPIICGINASIHLQGNSKTDPILSLKPNSAIKPASNLAKFRIENGQLELGQNAWIGTATSNVFFKDLTIEASNPAQPWKTIYLNGQNSHVLAYLDISGAKEGLTGRQFYGNGAIFEITDSKISDCETGLQIFSSGVNLIDCTIENNDIGMQHDLPTRPSRLQSCRLRQNTTDGLRVIQATADYRVEDSHFDDNGNDGITFSGPANLIPTCGSVNNNAQVGIRLGFDATLFMDNSYEQNGASMNVVGNQVSILLLNAHNIHLYGGRNDLMSVPYFGGQRDLHGNLMVYNSSTWTKPAAYNHWNNRSVACEGVSPVYGTDNIVQDLNGNAIYFSDFSRHCPPGQCQIKKPGNGQTSTMRMAPGTPSCTILETLHFKQVPIDEAVEEAIGDMEEFGGKDDLLALEKFAEILTYPLTTTNCAEAQALDLAHNRMRNCLLAACESGKVPMDKISNSPGLHPDITQLLDAQAAQCANQPEVYAQNLFAIDRAYTFYRIGRNDLAEAELVGITQQDENFGLAQATEEVIAYSRCMIAAQEKVLSGQIELADFEADLFACQANLKRAEEFSLEEYLTQMESKAVAGNTTSKMEILLYPVPASQEVQLKWTTDEDDQFEIVIFDALGKKMRVLQPGIGTSTMKIPTADLPMGTYLLQLRQGEEVFTRKFSVL